MRVPHLPLWLFVLALLVRVAWVLVAGRDALAQSDDAKAYNDLALNVVERGQFVTAIDPPHRLDVPYAQRPPLTPFVLAAVYFILGPHLAGGQLLMACLSALSVFALYRLGKQLFSDAIGIHAAVLAAMYPFFVFLAGLPLTENLAILHYILLALLLTDNHSERGSKHGMVTGCVLGLAALNRPQILGFFPLLVPLAFIRVGQGSANRVRWLGVALGCAILVIVPWTIRNRVVVG
ncbi:MAG: ArnT family glycosyltransferase, partial [bacterium]